MRDRGRDKGQQASARRPFRARVEHPHRTYGSVLPMTSALSVKPLIPKTMISTAPRISRAARSSCGVAGPVRTPGFGRVAVTTISPGEA